MWEWMENDHTHYSYGCDHSVAKKSYLRKAVDSLQMYFFQNVASSMHKLLFCHFRNNLAYIMTFPISEKSAFQFGEDYVF